MKVGDRVTLTGGLMRGTVQRVVRGPFSNGGRPMVTVEWDSGFTSRHTEGNLRAVES